MVKEKKIMGKLGNKMMPEETKKEGCKIVISDTVLHKGILYRKGDTVTVSKEDKKFLAKHIQKDCCDTCNCK
jgi:hypothetical protein